MVDKYTVLFLEYSLLLDAFIVTLEEQIFEKMGFDFIQKLLFLLDIDGRFHLYIFCSNLVLTKNSFIIYFRKGPYPSL